MLFLKETDNITDTNFYVPAVTLSNNGNVKLLNWLKSSFTSTTNWNKYQSKVTTQQQNRSLDYLTGPTFQGVNRFFVSLFPDDTVRTGHAECLILSVEIKDFNVVINGQNIFSKPVKKYKSIY